jgi:hypothetical protein
MLVDLVIIYTVGAKESTQESALSRRGWRDFSCGVFVND